MTSLVTCPRRTLRSAVDTDGIGIHTGEISRTTLRPAEKPGQGVVFRVAGANGVSEEIAARASNVAEAVRCTVLAGPGGTRVSTVEHLLSALAGMGVTDAVIEVEGPELPILDGSALPWVEAVRRAGIRDMGEDVTVRTLESPLTLTEPGGAFIAAYPAKELRITTAIAFDHPLIGTQVARFEPERGDYAAEVAPARTFGFEAEVAALLASGLARGGSLDNALIVHEDRFSSELRLENELVMHKVLDLVGDLYLVGGPFVADIVANKPSHRLNTKFARLWESRRSEIPSTGRTTVA